MAVLKNNSVTNVKMCFGKTGQRYISCLVDAASQPSLTAGLNLIQTRDKVCNLGTKQENKHFVPNTSFYLKHTLQSNFKETKN